VNWFYPNNKNNFQNVKMSLCYVWNGMKMNE